MLPVLLTIGPLSISSFGLFLAVAFLAAAFTIWRVARAYDLDEEKILDLLLLSFFGGLIGARLYFVSLNLEVFDSFLKVILINRYPGLSFWGGFLGGFLTLSLLTKRSKLQFWQIADFGSVAFLIGIAIGDIGCFLGGCGYGIESKLFLATPVVGLIGKRFPAALVESLLLLILFLKLYKMVLRFHFTGKIVSLFLIFLGTIKFFLEFLRGDAKVLVGPLYYGQLFSLLAICLGSLIFYTQSKRSILSDIKYILALPINKKEQLKLLLNFKKNWYNSSVALKVKLEKFFSWLNNLPTRLKKKLNVRSTPQEFR